MPSDVHVSGISHIIQLAVAPVFLLSGIGAMLAVMTGRIGRIVDRTRVLEPLLAESDGPQRTAIQAELSRLSRRARAAHWGISLCILCALLVSSVIAIIFLDAFLPVDVSTVVAGLFIVAMLALVGGLVCFLHEITLATATLPGGPGTERSAASRGG